MITVSIYCHAAYMSFKIEHGLACNIHDDVIKWKHFPRNWPFVRGIHRSTVNSPHKGQWRGALMFSLIWVWKNGWVNNGKAGDLRHHRAHYDVSVMSNSCGINGPTCVLSKLKWSKIPILLILELIWNKHVIHMCLISSNTLTYKCYLFK